VRLYKAHPEGVVTVKFRTQDAAQQCLEVMDGRWFGGQRIVVALWDGLTNYADVRRSATAAASQEEWGRT
jgi:HIV Tat-specific factor 1